MAVKWHGDKVLAKVQQGGAAGVRAAAEAVFAESQRRVPRETDELAETGQVEVDDARMRAEITYGTGLSDPRAVISHEKLEIRHDQGEPKYLEGPLRELADEAGGVIAAEIERHLK